MTHLKIDSSEYRLENKLGQWKLNGQDKNLNLTPDNDCQWRVQANGAEAVVSLLKKEDNLLTLRINGKKTVVAVETLADSLLKKIGGESAANRKISEVKAPMPGLIRRIQTAVGATVKKGDPLLALEAMKMENILKSPTDGVVAEICVSENMAVDKNKPLIRFV